jgi:trehalose-phosphatase
MTPSAPRIPRLLQQWDRVAAKLRAHRRDRIVVFLDFDGTLVDIAPRPELVRLKPRARRILEALARQPRVTLVVISGRRRAELLQHIGIRGIRYFGLYGWERSANSALPDGLRRTLDRARANLQHQLHAHPSVWIENKRSSLSVHLLAAPAAAHPVIRRQIRAGLKSFRRSLRAVENLRDVEVLPRSIPGKGKAVREFLAQPALRGAFPFYFGDDFSDESGFTAVRRRGISVQVGNSRATHAQFSLRSPDEVAAVLGKLKAAFSKG